MTTYFSVDIGTTLVKVAHFRESELVHIQRQSRFNTTSLAVLARKFPDAYVIISSVRHLSNDMQEVIAQHSRVFYLDDNLVLPIKILYETPETLGKDRIAAVVGAWSHFPSENSLVIDAGTCITYDLVLQDGSYLGGNISPGIRMRLNAMHLMTKKLPKVEHRDDLPPWGTTTETAMQVGASLGSLKEMEGFIKDYRKKFGKLNILLTGGDSHFFVNRLKSKIFASPNLVLEGLNKILQHNVQSI